MDLYEKNKSHLSGLLSWQLIRKVSLRLGENKVQNCFTEKRMPLGFDILTEIGFVLPTIDFLGKNNTIKTASSEHRFVCIMGARTCQRFDVTSLHQTGQGRHLFSFLCLELHLA